MSYKAIYLKPGGGYDNVVIGSCEAAAPKGGEITVRLRASSLNYHDFAVVSGLWGTERAADSHGRWCWRGGCLR